MNYKGHLNGGLVIATVNAVVHAIFNGIQVAAICFATALIFALYPDMDTGSIPKRHLSVIGVVAVGFLIFKMMYVPAGIILGLIIAPNFFKHRGFTHSIACMLLLCIVWMFFLSYFVDINFNQALPYSWAVVTGFMTHMILDKHFKLGL